MDLCGNGFGHNWHNMRFSSWQWSRSLTCGHENVLSVLTSTPRHVKKSVENGQIEMSMSKMAHPCDQCCNTFQFDVVTLRGQGGKFRVTHYKILLTKTPSGCLQWLCDLYDCSLLPYCLSIKEVLFSYLSHKKPMKHSTWMIDSNVDWWPVRKVTLDIKKQHSRWYQFHCLEPNLLLHATCSHNIHPSNVHARLQNTRAMDINSRL